ncbi:MAG: DNA-formamidopyrimidine glycosylase family protein, partial [Chryseobacterium sp.]
MPEGPSILLMKESIQKFESEKVLEAGGNSKIDNEILIGRTLKEIKTFGKQTYLVFDDVAVRIHLLMFGSHSVDEQTKPDQQLRLSLIFPNGSMYFYTCNVKMV